MANESAKPFKAYNLRTDHNCDNTIRQVLFRVINWYPNVKEVFIYRGSKDVGKTKFGNGQTNPYIIYTMPPIFNSNCRSMGIFS